MKNLTEQIISLAPALTQGVETIFADFAGIKDGLRDELLSESVILPVAPLTELPESLCAVDGARVQDKMYAADLLIAASESANGKTGQLKPDTPSKCWGTIVENDAGNSRINETAMASLEATLIAEVPHQVIILDGSFITPLIGIQEGIQARKNTSRNIVHALLTDPYTAPTEALRKIFTNTPDRPIIAIPKSDSSNIYAQYLNKSSQTHRVKLRDRFLATQILKHNEYLKPIPLSIYSNYSLVPHNETTQKQLKTIVGLQEVIDIFTARSANKELYFLYFKPNNSTTVIRLEFFATVDNVDMVAARHVSLINAETNAPHMLEPYAQAVVDRKAKGISPATKSLKSLIIQQLSDEERANYGHLLTQQYRT